MNKQERKAFDKKINAGKATEADWQAVGKRYEELVAQHKQGKLPPADKEELEALRTLLKWGYWPPQKK
jgi:hypothetical protein